MRVVLWVDFVRPRMEDEDIALELGWVWFVQGMKDEHGALELGWVLFVLGMRGEHGALELG